MICEIYTQYVLCEYVWVRFTDQKTLLFLLKYDTGASTRPAKCRRTIPDTIVACYSLNYNFDKFK